MILLDLLVFDTINHGILLESLAESGAGFSVISNMTGQFQNMVLWDCSLVYSNYTIDIHRDLSCYLFKHLYKTAGRDHSRICSKMPPICGCHSILFLLNWIWWVHGKVCKMDDSQ